MITFRYHVVSILAVLLALAVGVALGGGPLSEIGRSDANAEVQQENDQLSNQLAEARLAGSFQEEFVGQMSGSTVNGALKNRTVALLTMPGADQKTVQALTSMVTDSGGKVTGRYAAQPALYQPAKKTLVDTLGAQLAESAKGTQIPDTATTYDRMGRLIGRAVATTTAGGAAADSTAENIVSSLTGAELLSGKSATRASLVLVVLGDPEQVPEGTERSLAELFTGLATADKGVVVVGDTESSQDGTLTELRGEDSMASSVSTVDSVQVPAGRVATVLTLASAYGGGVGHYGANGEDGAIPKG